MTEDTRASGHAGLTGQCYGFTTPTVTGVEVIGPTEQDRALNIHFESGVEDAWFSPELVELLDHGAETTIKIGDTTLTRSEEGDWLRGE